MLYILFNTSPIEDAIIILLVHVIMILYIMMITIDYNVKKPRP